MQPFLFIRMFMVKQSSLVVFTTVLKGFAKPVRAIVL